MADDLSDYNFGGRISITAGTQRFTPSDGDVTIEPTNIKVDAKANGDGSPCYTASPKLYGAKIKFRDSSSITWDDIVRQSLDVTIVEEDNNRTHIFSSCRAVGEPEVNISNGEVSGMEIRGQQYQKLNS
jgi:Phage tail tube protein